MKRISIVFGLLIMVILACNETQPKVKEKEGPKHTGYGTWNKNAPKETIQYGRLVGMWDCLITNYQNDTIVSQTKANWVFKYALDGYAIQDFWKNPAVLDSTDQNQIIGTNIRIFNPQLDLWQCAWMENQASSISGIWLSHQTEEDEILLYDESKQWQITFYNISVESFDWKWEVRQPDGTLHINTTIIAKRNESL
ncbi:hypothetical protein [Flagellimonas meishanensis]|uniref:hypothetical protein n=1 Tax=Flagellimonas meishanensis TaxID=2873264 RepID=UPI001CA729B2|nr:hypothetical protein [[Muricauda] meishanensis]